jgi:hypothetical protein
VEHVPRCSQLSEVEVEGAVAIHETHNHRTDTMAQSDEDDDYMNMTFEDAPKGPKYETSLQRAARKRKEVRPLVPRTAVADD